MLHGFGCDSRVFASIGHKLSKSYDVLMVDIPGHGQTKEMFGDFSFSGYTILHALDHYLGEPYAILGWSMGGEIALEMYKQKAREKCKDLPASQGEALQAGPECKHDHNSISELILISSTPKFTASDDFKIGMNLAVFKKFKKGIESDAEKTMDDFYKMIFAKGEDPSKYIEELKKMTPPQNTLQDCMESFERFDERKAMPMISVPTLVITGDKDEVIDPKASMYLAQEIKGSKLKVLKGAGHAPHLTREAEVMDELTGFLG